MDSKSDEAASAARSVVRAFASIALTVIFFAVAAPAQEPSAAARSVEQRNEPQVRQTFFLVNLATPREMNDVQTDLRNMFPRAKIFGVATDLAITVAGTAEDVEAAHKLITELDLPRKVYRLTYTITDIDNGKPAVTHHFALVVTSGSGNGTEFKQGNRVPLVTGASDAGKPAQSTQVQYIDVGLLIKASLIGPSDHLTLHSTFEQSSVAADRSTVGIQDPVLHQTNLVEDSALVDGKPMLLGSVDIPGTTRHQEISLAAEQLQ